MCWFQIYKYEDLLLRHVSYHCKFSIFGTVVIGQRRSQDTNVFLGNLWSTFPGRFLTFWQNMDGKTNITLSTFDVRLYPCLMMEEIISKDEPLMKISSVSTVILNSLYPTLLWSLCWSPRLTPGNRIVLLLSLSLSHNTNVTVIYALACGEAV